ncbi:hypothetical protein BJ123_106125 [Rhodopseudomonas thermotolerans]|uniref:Uncharacterized protein n=2 Tax=Rhodopseudomonas TaxID=1073 RepID=A0A336JLE8_9BRAD|nr:MULTISPECIES: hypothetical protein [Rhodopseudomonas]RED37802.1 hypothetical protein BJ125_106126 [Rhodopseudomonas pentothenatexigens]REG04536.1 hypothetical protein BJ123_106125 [Rhodopseudomonas thermotolerans]SSW90302.1 hypothetical protein SAMN05892882_106126 [Rhodopseudomonas pentothenatexigens]
MGTIIEFPADAASRRPGSPMVASDRSATVTILPVIRIERHAEAGSEDGPQGAAPGRRRGRRARS